jgi:hypothetical protein
MADLCDCLAHKSAIVEELEDSLADLREERATSARQAAKVCMACVLHVCICVIVDISVHVSV